MNNALATAGVLIGALALGFASALVPVVNAEGAVLALALRWPTTIVVALAIAAALGQTAGKMVIVEAARRGRSLRHNRRRRATPLRRHRAWASRRRHWHDAALRTLTCRWRASGIVALSATVGVPPLALVSVGCGLARMRRCDFAVCCFLGRSARFLSLALPVAALSA